MLCDEILKSNQPFMRTGWHVDIAKQIYSSHKFVLSPHFAMAADALSCKTEELFKLLSFCHLPYPLCWIEVTGDDRRSFAEASISDHEGRPSKVGFLLEQTDSDMAWRSHIFWQFKESDPLGGLIGSSGYCLSFSPKIGKESFELSDASWIKNVFPEYLRKVVQRSQDDWIGEGSFLAAVLGLLNAKNVASSEAVDISKLNRSRRRLGRKPLFEYHLLKISDRVFARKKSTVDLSDEIGMRSH